METLCGIESLHEFALLLGFLFLQRGIEKNNKARYHFKCTSLENFKFHFTVCVIIVVWYYDIV